MMGVIVTSRIDHEHICIVIKLYIYIYIQKVHIQLTVITDSTVNRNGESTTKYQKPIRKVRSNQIAKTPPLSFYLVGLGK